jgi:hypothetical protein
MSQFVKTRGPHLYQGRETLSPGSVIELSDEDADQFVRRGMGTYSDGPAFSAPPPTDHRYGTKADGTAIVEHSFAKVMRLEHEKAEAEAEAQAARAAEPPRPVENATLSERLARAENATARPQRATSAPQS